MTEPPRSRRRDLSIPAIASRYGLLVAWLLVILVFSLLRPESFATTANFRTIFGTQAVLLILTLALIIPLTASEFDLSVAGVMGTALVLVGWLNVEHGWPVLLAILAALLAGVLIGLVNAFFIVVVGVESIIVTLGMGTILAGATVAINETTIGGISTHLVDVIRATLFGLPVAFYIALGLTAVVWYVFSYTPVGRYLFFVGIGPDMARLSGLRVNRLRVGSLAVGGGLSALAGVVLAGTLGASDPNVSTSYLLPAFAAAFLGSTVITPGRFNAWGSFIAVYFLVTGITGLQLLGLSGWIENVFYGASLIAAVSISRLLGRKRTAV